MPPRAVVQRPEPGPAAARLAPRVVLAAGVLTAFIVHARAAVLPYDDAFITFRYIDHALRGDGLVFNIGQRVYGFTSVVYLFWIAALELVFRTAATPSIAVRANGICFAATALSVFGLLDRVTRRRLAAACAAALVLVSPALLAISLGGMESFLFTALLFGCLWAAAQERPTAAGLLGGFAVLTRPEAMVLAPVLALKFRRSRPILQAATAFALPCATWMAFAWFYYGTLVPLPIVAKAARLYPIAPGTALADLTRGLAVGLTPWTTSGGSAAPTLTVLAAATILTIASAPDRRRGAWMPAAVFWLLLALYDAGNPLIFPWYWPVVLVSAMATLVAGACASSRWVGVRAPVVAAVGWIAACTTSAYLQPRTGLNAPFFSSDDGERLRTVAYKRAAEQLNAAMKDGERVASPEIGALGYYLRGNVLDACGLVSPEARPYLPVPLEQRLAPDVGAISINFVEGTTPEWVVTMPLFASRSLLASEWFDREYALWARVPLVKPIWGSPDLLVFKKRR